MKKILLSLAVAAIAVSVNAQTHTLRFEQMYEDIAAGIAAGTEVATYNSGSETKILVNQDRTSGIFTLVSPSNRTFRMDVTDVTFENGVNATIRVETNGASNTTNGRKIYIDCPTAGTLNVGAYSLAADRGYTVEKGGAVLFTQSPLPNMDKVEEAFAVYSYDITEAGRIELNPNAGIYYGFVEFVEAGTNSIGASEADKGEVVTAEYYDVTGRTIDQDTKGLVIKKLTYENGSTETVKTFVH